MVELDRPEGRIKYGAKQMRFSCGITKASIHKHAHTHTHTQNIQYLPLYNWLIPSDRIKRVAAKLTKTEKLRNELSVITIRFAKFYV